MRRPIGIAVALAAVALSVAPAAAQVCLGRGIGGLAARAVVAHAEAVRWDSHPVSGDDPTGTEVGVEYAGNPRAPIAYSVGAGRRILSGDLHDATVAAAELNLLLPQFPGVPQGAGLCATAGVHAAWGAGDFAASSPVDGAAEAELDLNSHAIPIGLALGITLPLTPATRLYPFVAPAAIYTRYPVVTRPPLAAPYTNTRSAVVFGIRAGIGLARGRLIARALGSWTDQPDDAAITALPSRAVSLELGLRF